MRHVRLVMILKKMIALPALKIIIYIKAHAYWNVQAKLIN